MVGRIAKKWHFCYTIHKTPHLPYFGVMVATMTVFYYLWSYFFCLQVSQTVQSDKQKQVSLPLSLFVMIHVLFLVHERNTHALCINFHASKKSTLDRENIIPLFIHLTFLNSTFSHQEKQSNSNLETLQNSLFSNIKKSYLTLPLPVQSQLVLGYTNTRHTQTPLIT